MTPGPSDGETAKGTNERDVSELGYTEASEELDRIVAFFEQRDVDVDQLVSRLERATALVAELDRRLRRTRAQVENLVPKLQAATGDPDARGEVAGSASPQDAEVAEHNDEKESPSDDASRDATPGLF